MNQKFFKLPKEKQDVILNAGFRVFAENSYKKAPMSEIAAAAGISKSLLFHYFNNKKELYLFLCDYAIAFGNSKLEKTGIWDVTDFFEMFEKALKYKCQIMRKYLFLNQFLIRAYYEEEPAIMTEVQRLSGGAIHEAMGEIISRVDTFKFKDGVDLMQTLQIMVWTADGYLRQQIQMKQWDIDRWEREFGGLLAVWKRTYYREEYQDEHH